MKIKKNIKEEDYLILKNGEKIVIVADKNIKSAIEIKCEHEKLMIIPNEKKS